MTSSASNITSSFYLNHNICIITLYQVLTLFLLFTIRNVFDSFSGYPNIGKKTSSRGPGVTPRILSTMKDFTINSARIISEIIGNYTYPTPSPTVKKFCYAPTSYFLQTIIRVGNKQPIHIPNAGG